MIDYANRHLVRAGLGTSRATYILSSKKALKIARNNAGVDQNIAEIVASAKLKSDLFPKVYDFDENGKWIIADLVRQLRNTEEFTEITGYTPDDFFSDVTLGASSTEEFVKAFPNTTQTGIALFDELSTIHKLDPQFGMDLAYDNWGITPDRRLVMLDSGMTNSIYEKWYE
jgi:hypothetical protein